MAPGSFWKPSLGWRGRARKLHAQPWRVGSRALPLPCRGMLPARGEPPLEAGVARGRQGPGVWAPMGVCLGVSFLHRDLPCGTDQCGPARRRHLSRPWGLGGDQGDVSR